MSHIDNLDGAIVSFLNYVTGTCIDLLGGGRHRYLSMIENPLT